MAELSQTFIALKLTQKKENGEFPLQKSQGDDWALGISTRTQVVQKEKNPCKIHILQVFLWKTSVLLPLPFACAHHSQDVWVPGGFYEQWVRATDMSGALGPAALMCLYFGATRG